MGKKVTKSLLKKSKGENVCAQKTTISLAKGGEGRKAHFRKGKQKERILLKKAKTPCAEVGSNLPRPSPKRGAVLFLHQKGGERAGNRLTPRHPDRTKKMKKNHHSGHFAPGYASSSIYEPKGERGDPPDDLPKKERGKKVPFNA